MGTVHNGHRDRMRARYLQEGADAFANHELLEMLLYGTIPRGDTNEMAHHLLDEFGSISNLIEADPYEIAKIKGIGLKSGVFLSLLHELVLRYEREKLVRKPALMSLERSVDYCMSLLAMRQEEEFYVICMDGRRKILHTAKMAKGSVNEVMVNPRLVVEKVFRYKATGVLFCHNHPRGNVRPSREDMELTMRLKNMLEPLGIQVADHIIIGENQYFSFFENGLLKGEKTEE